MIADAGKTALVVGASRGLGLGLVEIFLERGWRVVATARDFREKLEALASTSGGALEIETLDVTRDEGIGELRARLAARTLDVLFVSAGVIDDSCGRPIGEVATQEFLRLMQVNALAPLRVVEALHDLVPPGGVIGAMSSGLGSVSRNESGGFEAYRASKAALNMMMRSFATRAGGDRAVVLMDPGWVRTEMGGPDAPLCVRDSAPGIVETLIGAAGRTGAHFLNYRGEPVSW